MMLCNYPAIFMNCTTNFRILCELVLSNFLHNNQLLANFELSQGLPFLMNMSKWAHQWKILFYPDPQKQAQEVTFSKKSL